MKRLSSVILMSLLLMMIAYPAMSAEKGKVAIYEGKGTWDESTDATRKLIDSLGRQAETVSADTIKKQGLSGYAAFVVPGGWAPNYNESLGTEGINAIRDYVRSGGVYIGYCAGAYFASGKVTWEGTSYVYPLGLMQGTASGPLSTIAKWPDKKMTRVRTEKGLISMLYGGGPQLFPAAGESVKVLATWEDYWDTPAAITFTCGKGRVFITGAHPEVSGEEARQWLKDILAPLLMQP